jgi:hypothetical protein
MTDRWRRAEALFHEMLARPAAERAAALAAECPDDPGLRAAVQSLLDRPNPPTEFLEAPAAEIFARLLSQPDASTLSCRRLGVFELRDWDAMSPSRSCRARSGTIPRDWLA